MKPQAFQPGELRDEHDQIIRAGAYGKKTPFVSSDNNAILDYIMNNFDALYAQIPNGRAYVKSVNNITPDSNGNVTINLGSGGGTGSTNITVDSTLSSTSNNAIANKAVYAALNNKLDKTGVAAYATRDDFGNIIADTYAKKSEVSGVVKSVNNIAPDSNGNVTITVSGGGTGTNITVDSVLSSTSTNPVQNRVVQQEFTSVRSAIPTKVSQLSNDSGYQKTAEIPVASKTQNGYMSKYDKAKLDGLSLKSYVLKSDYSKVVLPNGHISINGSEMWIE